MGVKQRIMASGLFKSQERPKQEANRLPGLGIKDTHLLRDIGHPQEIQHGQQKTVEHSQNTGSVALADLTVIFTQRHIAAPMQAVFNGIITNDKFCLSRIRRLPKLSARKGFPQEIKYPSEAIEQVCCPKVEIDEETTVEHSTLHNSGSRGTAPLGSSLSTAAPMERTNSIPLPPRVTITGESR